MAIDHEQHEIEPRTGFAIHKETGHILGLMQAPTERVPFGIEYPKWVVPHESHVIRDPGSIVVPQFPQIHVNRIGNEVTVMVADADEEAKALAPKEEAKTAEHGGPAADPAAADGTQLS